MQYTDLGRIVFVTIICNYYYWAADEYDEHRAYYVSYNGEGINHQPKFWGNQRHGYRFVREP